MKDIKYLLPIIATFLSSITSANAQNQRPLTVAYVEVNDHDIENVGCFRYGDGSQVFDIAVIFAANINYDGERATLHFNPQVTRLLKENIHKVRNLQQKGLRVLLDVLGNHQNAGWSCFANELDAYTYATTLKDAVDLYGLDGIDIDDEYSKCERSFDDSLIKVTSALRQLMPEKIISKTLWTDSRYFASEWNGLKLHEQLDYGWEVSYGSYGANSRVLKYRNLGMAASKLGVGVSANHSSYLGQLIYQEIQGSDLGGGLMVYNVRADSANFLSRVLGEPVLVNDGCLH